MSDSDEQPWIFFTFYEDETGEIGGGWYHDPEEVPGEPVAPGDYEWYEGGEEWA